MRLRREASLGIGAILGLQLLLCMLAIALLSRMGPAIERILEENVYSEAAVEEMLAMLATSPSGASVPAEFDAALLRAEANVTEADEVPVLEAIERDRAAAFEGHLIARAEVVAGLRKLGEVNRESMVRADRRARRLGQAGAWAAALLGALALALAFLTYRRLRLRIEIPIEGLRATTQRVRGGNFEVRCSTSDCPIEIHQIADDLNWLLDRLIEKDRSTTPPDTSQDERDLRRLLVWLLDQERAPRVILDANGRRVATNTAAMDVELPELPLSEDAQDWEVNEIPSTHLRCLRRLSPAANSTSPKDEPEEEDSPPEE